MSDFDMQVSGTQKGIDGVRQATDVIQQAWSHGQAAIGAEEGQLGRGKLGLAFMSVYRPEADRAGQQVRVLTTGGHDLVAASRRGVAEYEAVDERTRAEFERLLSPAQQLAWGR